MFFAEVNSSDLVPGRSTDGFCLVLSTNHKPTGTLPDLDRTRLFIDRPVDQYRVLTMLRRQTENSIISEPDALVGPPEHVVFFVTALWRIALAVVVMSGADRQDTCSVALSLILHRFLDAYATTVGEGASNRQVHTPRLKACPDCCRGRRVYCSFAHPQYSKPVILAIYCAPPFADPVPKIRGS
jgi:hypothetical protein